MSKAGSELEPEGGNECATSYRGILTSSSLIGGSSALNILTGLVAAKAGAVFLGPQGVGLLKLFVSTLEVVKSFASLGISSSGVREIAEAVASGDDQRAGNTIRTLRQLCLATGLLGWALTAILAYPLSLYIFGSSASAGDLALLGATVLFATVAGGQLALLQGMRQVLALATVTVISGLLSAILALLFYWQMAGDGIVPALLAGSLLTLLVSWLFARRVTIPKPRQAGIICFMTEAKRLISLGSAFMWSGVMVTGVAFFTNACITRELGLQANGIYGSAWSLSGAFATFILGAMGTDFLPRLAAINTNNTAICRLVNEQTEIGILLALPGLVATILFAPFIIELFYSAQFAPAVDLLPWFVLGVFGRITAWPMGYILIAKGEAKIYAVSETLFSIVHICLMLAGLFWAGLFGIAVSFCLLYVLYNIAMYKLTHRLVGMAWTAGVWRLVVTAGFFVAVSLLLALALSKIQVVIAGSLFLALSFVFVGRSLIRRTGLSERSRQLIGFCPGLRCLFGC